MDTLVKDTSTSYLTRKQNASLSNTCTVGSPLPPEWKGSGGRFQVFSRILSVYTWKGPEARSVYRNQIFLKCLGTLGLSCARAGMWLPRAHMTSQASISILYGPQS